MRQLRGCMGGGFSQLRSRVINRATASTRIKITRFETSPARMAWVRLAEPPGIVVGNITATKTTPQARGTKRPVTGAVLNIVITRAMISPMRNTSVNCENTRSITWGFLGFGAR